MKSRLFFAVFIFLIIVLAVNATFAFSQTFSGDTVIGKIVRSEGQVRVFKENTRQWEAAVSGTVLFQGDKVQTGGNGWAALVMNDESMIQLNRNTELWLKQTASRAGWLRKINTGHLKQNPGESEYYLDQGQFWLRNKNINQKINIETPYVSTSIRGTELDISIAGDQTVVVSVLEGRVSAKNQHGSVLVNALERAVAKPGYPIVKEILLTPDDAVQWTISLQPVIHRILDMVRASGNVSAGWQCLFDGQQDRAKELFAAGRNRNNPLELLGLSIAYGISRDFEEAKTVLEEIKRKWPEYAPSWAFDALMAIILNDQTGALDSAQKAVALCSGEPLFHVIHALALQAGFDLEGALEATQTALHLDGNNTEALINLSRLKLAGGYLEESFPVVDKILKIDPENAEALNLKGYLWLAMKKNNPAMDSFEAAARLNPYSGEPHMGLCLAYMRKGDMHHAFEQIAIAVLLEPRRSVFLSYWAKMLYESKRFEQALDILDLAQRLDPKDPTPHLYRSHILRDLNRIHEAVFALQKAVELNDNQAIYKSRFFLDRDLAVKNVNLAQMFYKLGISEWAGIKSMASLKKDNHNSAAHDFVASQLNYLHGPSSYSARSESLKAFLMKPAAANALNSFNNYTIFFDQPGLNGTVEGWVGEMGYLDGILEIHGALPESNTAFQLTARGYRHDGWQNYDWKDEQKITAALKWDMTYKDTLSLQCKFSNSKTGDLSAQTQYDRVPDPLTRQETTLGYLNAGYVRHISPESEVIFHIQREYKRQKHALTHLAGTGNSVIASFAFDYQYDYNMNEWLDDPFTAVQAMHSVTVNTHQFSYGAFVYESNREYQQKALTASDYFWAGTGIFAFNSNEISQAFSSKTRNLQSYYIQDTWSPWDRLTLEGALYAESIANINSAENLTWSDSYYHPRFGIIFRPTLKDTIAFSYIKYLQPYDAVARIDAVDVAGHILPSYFEGSIIEEVALGYGREWSTGALTTKYFINRPNYSYLTVENNAVAQKELDQKYIGCELAVNQLLFSDIGVAAGYTFFDIERDMAAPLMESKNNWYWIRLTKAHSSGITASIGAGFYDTDYDSRAMEDRDFLVLSSYIEYELPKKTGKIRFQALNLFDEHFNGVTLSDVAGLVPQRSCSIMLALNF